MTDTTKLVSEFRISDSDLDEDPAIKEANEKYCGARQSFSDARRDLLESRAKLQELLDQPLRNAGLIPEGKEWTLSEDEEDGLRIRVWSEPRRRGRRKPEIPTKQVSFQHQKSKLNLLKLKSS